MAMRELKPCPFCGNLPHTEVRVTQMGGDVDKVDFSVVCSSCGTGKIARLTIAKTAKFDEVVSTMNKAVEAWNRRCSDA